MKDFLFTVNSLLAVGIPLVFWGFIVYFGWGVTVDPVVKVAGALLHALAIILGLNAWEILKFNYVSKELAEMVEG